MCTLQCGIGGTLAGGRQEALGTGACPQPHHIIHLPRGINTLSLDHNPNVRLYLTPELLFWRGTPASHGLKDGRQCAQMQTHNSYFVCPE